MVVASKDRDEDHGEGQDEDQAEDQDEDRDPEDGEIVVSTVIADTTSEVAEEVMTEDVFTDTRRTTETNGNVPLITTIVTDIEEIDTTTTADVVVTRARRYTEQGDRDRT